MYIAFSDGEKISQQQINDNTILDLADDLTVVGMEILDATGTYGNHVLEFSLSLLGKKLIKPEKSAYTTEAAAQLLQINKETILRKIRTGEITAFRLGKSYHIPTAELKKLAPVDF